jgi:hypothetical protein
MSNLKHDSVTPAKSTHKNVTIMVIDTITISLT